MKNTLITGGAGFIGFHLAKKLLQEGYLVTSIDTINNYYSPQLKIDRINEIKNHPNFNFHTINICDKDALDDLFSQNSFSYVINLAAQAGVRHSIEKPYKYIDSNLIGFINILEACRQFPVEHLVFASSSSVYGANSKIPFSTSDHVDHPVSLYAATKKSNEMMAHSYAALYDIPTTGLRFFTVYGPWGRPDMAYFSFTKAILEGSPIKVFNEGNMQRDFTYIDDIVTGIYRLLPKKPEKKAGQRTETLHPGESFAPYKLYNIGNHSPIKLMDFIKTLETIIGKKAELELLPMQPGDVPVTYADVQELMNDVGFKPDTPLETGLHKFYHWYKNYYP